MQVILNLIQKLLIFDKEPPQKIGLTQLRQNDFSSAQRPSIKSKDIKLSDLMRRAS